MFARSPARRQPRSTARCREVLEAALACFAEKGIAATAIEDICTRAGASVGSVYHLFGSKDGVAAAVYRDALADFQAALRQRLGPEAGAREGVLAIIAAHIAWVEKNPERTRFLHEARHTETVAAHAAEIGDDNRAFGLAIAAWAKTHMAAGILRRMPGDLFIAQLLGPTHEYVRARLAGREAASASIAKRALGDAAWRALGSEGAAVDAKGKRGAR
jgi:AcrR family transcriptional regulator